MTRDELLRKWVEALRSGEYRQNRGSLRVGNQYCCLGVLCDVSGLGAWNENYHGTPFAAYVVEGILPESGIPPYDVNHAAGLIGNVSAHHFAKLNDEREMTFSQIADEIERLFPAVFTESVV